MEYISSDEFLRKSEMVDNLSLFFGVFGGQNDGMILSKSLDVFDGWDERLDEIEKSLPHPEIQSLMDKVSLINALEQAQGVSSKSVKLALLKSEKQALDNNIQILEAISNTLGAIPVSNDTIEAKHDSLNDEIKYKKQNKLVIDTALELLQNTL